ncbi:MAG: response regulator transcription factor, partial [Steroidobacteraceae bacterium]
MKILVVDDDADLLSLVGFSLSQAGFVVVKAADVPTALKVFAAESPDLAILDINLPGGSGFDICEGIRKQSRIPVMMLTARGEEEDLVRALDLGADDYLTKPFSPRTLLARVRALLRRAWLETGGAMSAGSLRLDLESHALHVGDAAPVKLTKLETRLLQI